MNYTDFSNELLGVIPKMPFPFAQRCVNRAYRDIRESRLWSWLLEETVLTSRAIVGAGTVNLTQYSTVVVPDATAKPVWDALANPLITQRQFRGAGGPVYLINSYDPSGAGTLTLDRPYQEATNTAAVYQIYCAYFWAPAADFLRWVSVFDPTQGYWLERNHTKAEIDRRDPLRADSGNPFWIVSYKTDTRSTASTYRWPMYEMWPHATSDHGYQAIYQRRGADFTNPTDTLPPGIQESLLMERAMFYAYQWAEANKGRFAELRGSDWRFLMSKSAETYKAMLWEAQRQDEETMSQDWICPLDPSGYIGDPVDADFAQSHTVDWINY
jgi:hypothetical protein